MQKRNDIQRFLIGKRIFSVLVALAIFSFVLYGYFISVSVVNVLVRESASSDIVAISSKVSDLETQYLALKNEITIEYAYANGFKDIKDKRFTTRTSLANRGLTVNTQ